MCPQQLQAAAEHTFRLSSPLLRLTGAQKELARLGVSEVVAEAPGCCPRARSRPCASAGLRPKSTLCRLRCRRSRFLFSEGSSGGVPLHGYVFCGCRAHRGVTVSCIGMMRRRGQQHMSVRRRSRRHCLRFWHIERLLPEKELLIRVLSPASAYYTAACVEHSAASTAMVRKDICT